MKMDHLTPLPTEILTLIAEDIPRISDLNAFAQANHACYEVVNPILYLAALEDEKEERLPLKWAAITGRVGTLMKALAAGFTPGYIFCDPQPLFTPPGDITGLRVNDPQREWKPREARQADTMPRFSSQRQPLDTWYNEYDFEDDGALYDRYQLSDGEANSMSGDRSSDDDDDDDGYDEDNGEESGEEEERRSVLRDGKGGCAYTALHLAAKHGHDTIVQILLDHGADINGTSYRWCECRRAMSRVHSSQGVRSNRNLPIRPAWTPLHAAMCHGQTRTAKLLLSRGASVVLEPKITIVGPSTDQGNGPQATALHHAAGWGHTDLVNLILDKGYVKDIDTLDEYGLTAFYYAYANNQWDTTVPLLVERGANTNFMIRVAERDFNMNYACTTLYEACAYGLWDEAIKLVDFVADVNQGEVVGDDTSTYSPLHACCQPSFNPPLGTRVLQIRKAKKKKSDWEIQSLRQQLIERLISKGANPNLAAGPDQGTPLHHAVMYRIISAVKSLLAAGADVHRRNIEGHTPLMAACSANHFLPISKPAADVDPLEIIALLLEHGSRIEDVGSCDGNTPLHIICQQPGITEKVKKRVARFLLDRGLSPHVRNTEDRTAFHLAFKRRCFALCDILRRRETVHPFNPDDLREMAGSVSMVQPRYTHDISDGTVALDMILDMDVKRSLHSEPSTLLELITRDDIQLANHFLERGIPSMDESQKARILQDAISKKAWGIAKKIAASGCRLRDIEMDESMALWHVVSCVISDSGSNSFVKYLLDNGASIHSKPTGTSMAPLQMAITHDNVGYVAMMLDKCPLRDDPNYPNGVYLHTAVHAHVRYQYPRERILRLLLLAGADRAEMDEAGDTPLSLFLRDINDWIPTWFRGKPRGKYILYTRIWYLWQKDLDVNRKNHAGKSVVDYLHALMSYTSEETHRRWIARFLRQHIRIIEVGNGTKGIEFLGPPPRVLSSPSTTSLEEMLEAEQDADMV